MPPLHPTRLRMTRHALDILKSAQEEAAVDPVRGTPAMRLALSWLVMDGVAEAWQATSFWLAATKPPEAPDRPLALYVRQRDMQIYIDRWERVVQDACRD